jgi:hypothetical protein
MQLLFVDIQVRVFGGFLEGFRRWRGCPFWLHKETLTFKGPAA